MKLKDEPGQDVENFGNKRSKMANQISRTGYSTIDIYELVATAFVNWEALEFQLKDKCLHDLIDSNPKSPVCRQYYQASKKVLVSQGPMTIQSFWK